VLYSDCKVPRVPRRTGAAPETFHSAASGSQVPMLIKYLVYYLVYSKVRGPSVDARVYAFMSVPLVLEYEAVLTREEHRKVRGLSVLEVNEIINSLASVAESAQIRFLWRPLLPDPADDMVLETAGRRSSRPACHVQPRGFRGCGKRTGTPLMPLLARE